MLQKVFIPNKLAASFMIRASANMFLICYEIYSSNVISSTTQKQPSRVVLRKRCSEMKVYSKFTRENPCRNAISPRHGCSPVNLLHIFRTSFRKNTYGGLLMTSLNLKESKPKLLIIPVLDIKYNDNFLPSTSLLL